MIRHSPTRYRASPNHDARPEGMAVDVLVFHYTGMLSAKAALNRLCDPLSRVSSHYLVEEDGRVWQLVPQARRAWHAGVSSWRGMTALNDRSIGIEIANPGHHWGYRPFPPPQLEAVRRLSHAILAHHPIAPQNVVGHSDIAPHRKQDPGEWFPFATFAADGIGLACPDDADAQLGEATLDAAATLAALGYDVSPPVGDAVVAFKRHWLPTELSPDWTPAARLRAGGLMRRLGIERSQSASGTATLMAAANRAGI